VRVRGIESSPGRPPHGGPAWQEVDDGGSMAQRSTAAPGRT
jgi:hypothetical protein